MFLIFFHWSIPLYELTILVYPTLEYVFQQKDIHLCASWLNWCFLRLKIFPKEVTPLCECFQLKEYFQLKNIKVRVSWLRRCSYTWKCFFTWRIYTSMGVDKVENIIYPKNVHLYASVFPLENIYLCACTQKWCFLSLKCLLLKEYTPLCKFFSTKNIHLFLGD